MAYTTIDNPELYFQAKLYTGNGSNDHAQTFDGDEDMQPDLNWIKERSSTSGHRIFDSVRGSTKYLESSDTSAEGTSAANSATFDSDGFTVDDGAAVNEDTVTYVAWCWKAGTAFSNDASATSIGTIDSSGSASDTAGFSIVSYTGNATNGATVAHGLSSAPQMVITKNRADEGTSWQVLTNIYPSYSEGDYIYLSSTQAKANSANVSFLPTSTTWQMESGQAGNIASTQIAYCFAEKQGFSKFGSYEGNGNAASPFIFLGFRPAFVLIRNVDSVEGWTIFDNKRDGYNAENRRLYPHSAEAEANASQTIDMLSNGFKVRSSTEGLNKSGDTIIFAAFAEAPFVNSNGVPCNAR
jgi:hypothetical protein